MAAASPYILVYIDPLLAYLKLPYGICASPSHLSILTEKGKFWAVFLREFLGRLGRFNC